MKFKRNIVLYTLTLFILANTSNATEKNIFDNTTINGSFDYNFEATRVNGKNSKLSELDINLETVSKLNENNKLLTKLNYENNYYNSSSNESKIDLENFYLDSKYETITSQIGRVNITGPFVDGTYADGINIKIKPSTNYSLEGSYYFKNYDTAAEEETKIGQFHFYTKINYVHLNYFYSNVEDYYKAYSIYLDMKNDIAHLHAMYTKARYENTDASIDTPTLTKAFLDINYGFTKTRFSLGWSGDEGNYVTLDKSSDAGANYKLWQLDIKNKADSTVYGVDITARVLPRIDLRGAIVGGKVQNFKDAVEHLGEVKYTYNKDLTISLKGSRYKESDTVVNPITTLPVKFYTRFYKAAFEVNYKF